MACYLGYGSLDRAIVAMNLGPKERYLRREFRGPDTSIGAAFYRIFACRSRTHQHSFGANVEA
jgi:hypothetical protein